MGNFDTMSDSHGAGKALEDGSTTGLNKSVEEDGYTKEDIGGSDDNDFLNMAKEAYRASDDWFDIAVRRLVERDLHLFNSVHPAGSKYNDSSYDKRSQLFRPKTRSQVRKMEAAAATAFFSTNDAISCEAVDDNDEAQVLAAKVKSDLVNYHLQQSIPWFITCIGGLQDACKQGVVISKQVWKYEEVTEAYEDVAVLDDGAEIPTGNFTYEYKVVHDHPAIILLPIENIRISPACDWTDPINSSPFLVELIPYYIGDLKAMIVDNGDDPHGLPYRDITEAELTLAIKHDYDSVRQAREGEREDRFEAEDTAIRDFQTVWVHRNFIRKDGTDWVYDTLGTQLLLSDPVPREDVYPTKLRPYQMGQVILETHKLYPASQVGITKELQDEINDIANLRIDNIRLGINPRYFIKRQAVVDTRSLLRNVAGGITYVDNPNEDVKIRPITDVTKGSYEEADRLATEMDELVGNFSGSSVQNNNALDRTLGSQRMLKEDANQVTELTIRTFSETWVEGVLKQTIENIQALETDERVMAMIGKRHGLNVSQTFRLMDIPVLPTVNVGFGATNPTRKMEKLTLAISTVGKYFPQLLQEADMGEIVSEVFGAVGYKDGLRFFPSLDTEGDDDPRIKQLQQQVQELTSIIESDQVKEEVKLKGIEMREMARVQIEDRRLAQKERKEQRDHQLKAQIERKKIELGLLNHELGKEKNKLTRQQLFMQQEALTHSILMDERELGLEAFRLNREGQETGGEAEFPNVDYPDISPESRTNIDRVSQGAPNLEGDDEAGVISRGKYGNIPLEEG